MTEKTLGFSRFLVGGVPKTGIPELMQSFAEYIYNQFDTAEYLGKLSAHGFTDRQLRVVAFQEEFEKRMETYESVAAKYAESPLVFPNGSIWHVVSPEDVTIIKKLKAIAEQYAEHASASRHVNGQPFQESYHEEKYFWGGGNRHEVVDTEANDRSSTNACIDFIKRQKARGLVMVRDGKIIDEWKREFTEEDSSYMAGDYGFHLWCDTLFGSNLEGWNPGLAWNDRLFVELVSQRNEYTSRKVGNQDRSESQAAEKIVGRKMLLQEYNDLCRKYLKTEGVNTDNQWGPNASNPVESRPSILFPDAEEYKTDMKKLAEKFKGGE